VEKCKRFDAACLSVLEAWCRLCERVTGKTNFFWLELLSGIYAVFLLAYVLTLNFFEVTMSPLGQVGIVGLGFGMFFVSFRLAGAAEAKARERAEIGAENPAKTNPMHRMFRLILLFNFLSPFVCYLWFSFQYPEHMWRPSVLIFMLVLAITTFLHWICALLYACDPLPKTQHAA
jgi:hypothetical protein